MKLRRLQPVLFLLVLALSLPLLTFRRHLHLSRGIAKYYSLRRFVAATGEPASGWARRRDDGRLHFHYSTGLQAVVMALGAFGFGKAAATRHHYHTDRKEETEVHDYEAEYQFYRDLQSRPEAVPFLDEAPGFNVPPVKQYW